MGKGTASPAPGAAATAEIDWDAIIAKAKKRAMRGGIAGSAAMFLQVRCRSRSLFPRSSARRSVLVLLTPPRTLRSSF
jgi:hypothetical protein